MRRRRPPMMSPAEYLATLTPESPIIRRIFARTVLDGGHFMWRGAKSKGGGKRYQPHPGYPNVWVPELQTAVRGHRIVYAAYHGPLPDGYQRDHTCNRSLCLNPACMEPVTNAENTRRRDARRRGTESPTDWT